MQGGTVSLVSEANTIRVWLSSALMDVVRKLLLEVQPLASLSKASGAAELDEMTREL